MRVLASTPTRPVARRVAAGAIALSLALAACGASASSTMAPVATAPAASPVASRPAATSVAASTVAPRPAATSAPAPIPSKTPSLPALDELWAQGGPTTDKTSTEASAIDPITGNVWVAVPFENRYWIMSPDGKYLESWGKAGSGPGQFDFSDHAQNPDGFGAIAFAPDGSFYVGDTGNHRVQAFDAGRHFVRQWGTFGSDDGEFLQLATIATDGKAVYVGDGQRWDIQAFRTDGTFLRSFGADGGFWAISLGRDGAVRAVNGEFDRGVPMEMAIFDPDGSMRAVTDLTGFGGRPESTTVDTAGEAYVAIELDRYPFTALAVVEVDPAGKVVRSWADSGGDVLTVTPGADAIYASCGIQLDGSEWKVLRKYALPTP